MADTTAQKGMAIPLTAFAGGAVVAVRSRRAPGWFLPVAGGLLFALLVLAVLTSAAWYVGAKGWPSQVG